MDPLFGPFWDENGPLMVIKSGLKWEMDFGKKEGESGRYVALDQGL